MAIALAIKTTAEETKMSRAAAVAGAVLTRPAQARALPMSTATDRGSSELERIGVAMLCRKGQALVQEGDRAEYIYTVTSGALRAVRLLPDGRRYIANFLMPGDFIGLTEGESYGHSIEAISDAGLLRYPRSSFETLLDRDPRAGRRFFGVMCKELTAVQDRLLLLGRKTATERLASFLLAMAGRKAGNGNGNGRARVELPMNRSDMADYLGLRIETVCRLLTDLKARRIIDLPDIHSVVVLRRDDLEDLSEAGV